MAQVRTGSARCSALGAAVHLGGGRFVTAAHVVDGSVQRLRGNCPAGDPPALLVGGATVPGRLLRAGRDRIDPGIGQRYFAGEDVAVLAEARPLPTLGRATLCAEPPAAGAAVLLVTPRRAVRTRLLGLWSDADPAFGSYLEIPETLAPGESGGALFDAATGCLAGLVSHRDEDGAAPRTRLVPAAVIARVAAS